MYQDDLQIDRMKICPTKPIKERAEELLRKFGAMQWLSAKTQQWFVRYVVAHNPWSGKTHRGFLTPFDRMLDARWRGLGCRVPGVEPLKIPKPKIVLHDDGAAPCTPKRANASDEESASSVHTIFRHRGSGYESDHADEGNAVKARHLKKLFADGFVCKAPENKVSDTAMTVMTYECENCAEWRYRCFSDLHCICDRHENIAAVDDGCQNNCQNLQTIAAQTPLAPENIAAIDDGCQNNCQNLQTIAAQTPVQKRKPIRLKVPKVPLSMPPAQTPVQKRTPIWFKVPKVPLSMPPARNTQKSKKQPVSKPRGKYRTLSLKLKEIIYSDLEYF